MKLLHKNSQRALTALEIVIIIVIVSIIVAIALPNFLGCCVQKKISRSRSDQHSLATALEAYFLDHKAYPAMRPLRELANHPDELKEENGWDLMTIEPGREGLAGLTTPFAYIAALPRDSFLGMPFAYFTDGTGWILFSSGPDCDFDIVPERDYNSSIEQPSDLLLGAFTYDPTNFTVSDGDMWQVKQ